MSRPSGSAELLTAEQFLLIAQSQRCELIRGQVVERMPPGHVHAEAVAELARQLGNHIKERDLGRLRVGDPGFLVRRQPDTVRAPDIAFLARERLEPEGTPAGYSATPPDLVVEVVSPSDTWSELEAKSREWLRFGVRELWIADPQLGEIRVLRDGEPQQVFGSGDELRSALLPGFTAPVQALLGRD